MKRLSDLTTYADLAGRRRPRRYILATGVLIGLVLVVLIWGVMQRQRARAEVFGRQQPQTIAGTETESLATDGLMPENVSAASEHSALCPPDPSSWTFLPLAEVDLFSIHEPACVIVGLEKTVAWMLLTRLGYSRLEASAELGFAELPWQAEARVPGFRSAQEIQLTYEWPAHPTYRYWIIAEDHTSGLTASLYGCYQPQVVDLQGSTDFQVLCAVWIKYAARWGLHQLDHLTAVAETDGSIPSTTMAFIGYRSQEGWAFLGENLEPIDFDDPHPQFQAVGGPARWDAEWLQEEFDIHIRPLPADWQSATDPAVLAKIGQELTRYVNHE